MTFKSTIERVSDPRVKSLGAGLFSGIAGYDAYAAGKAPDISGIVARGATLTIRLSQPDGGFLANLAQGWACAVPPGTPADEGGLNDIPSAGPYYIVSYTPRQQLVLRENPNYGGDRPHRLDQIVFTIGVDPVRAVERIGADTATTPPTEFRPRLLPGSRRSTTGKQGGEGGTAALLRQRGERPASPAHEHEQAALLRRATAAGGQLCDRSPRARRPGKTVPREQPVQRGGADGPVPAASTPGATSRRLYPTRGPDRRRAKELAGRLQATAVLYIANLPLWRQEAEIVRRDLKPLGIDVQVKEFAVGDFFTRISRPGEPFDLAVSGYFFPPDPGVGLEMFDGATIGSQTSANYSYFDDPAFNRRFKAAKKLSGAERYRASGRLAFELARDAAPAAAIGTTTSHDFFSDRIGCQLYQPNWGIDLAALCDNRGPLRPSIPPGLPVASKQGWISTARHSATIIYTHKGPLALVLLTYREALPLVDAEKLGRRVFLAVMPG